MARGSQPEGAGLSLPEHLISLSSATRKPGDFFKEFDLGAGGYSIGPARQSRALIKDKLRFRRGGGEPAAK